ncbi:MAG: hypothetical protein KA184_21840, partial [Candidatus Hydrogenedentes bacterium]|nr:hypothetical protein [Candidatus Hydrogenedentota bacterium]
RVDVAEGVSLGLRVDAGAATDLAPLAAIEPPEVIAALWLPAFTVNETNVGQVARLKGLRDLTVESGLSSADKLALAAALPPDCALKAELPFEVLRNEADTPPGDRVLRFPADYSLGRLYTRLWRSDYGITWDEFGEARGERRIPAGMQVKLVVDYEGARDLSPLLRLHKNDLHTLVLVGEHITDATLGYVRGLSYLRGLELSYTKVTDQGLTNLREMRLLQQIKLVDISMSDMGFAEFDNCKDVNYLYIDGANITNRCMTRLRALKPSLARLHIDRTGVTFEAMDELTRYLDKCEVTPPASR